MAAPPPSQLDFIAALREEEEDHGITPAVETPLIASDISSTSNLADLDNDFKDVSILYFGSEGIAVSHEDVNVYKTKLFGKGAVSERTAARQLLLSDEAPVSTVDRARLDAVLSQLHFDCQPQVRGWTMSGNPETATSQFYNYGLNENLFHEFLEQQILLRLNRVARQSAMPAPYSGMTSSMPGPSGPPPPGPSVYVTNFPIEWTQQDLASMFGRFGLLESVAMMTGRKGYGTRGAAFVNFARQEDAARAIEHLNGTSTGQGRDDFRLNVNYARSKTRVPHHGDSHHH